MAHILVVDGYVGFREAMAFCLPTFGHSVTTFPTAEFSLSGLAASRAEIVIVGISPTMEDSFAVCRSLREHHSLTGIPWVVLGNPLTAEIRTRADALGAAAVLEKPFDWPEFLALLDRLTVRGPH